MIETILGFLSSLDLTMLYSGLGVYIFLTAMGLAPNHNDIFLSVLIFQRDRLGLSVGGIFLLFFIAEGLGETISFLVCKKYGHKLLNSKFVLKKFPKDKQDNARKIMDKNPFWVVLLLRFMPIGRPYFIMIAACFNIGAKSFFKYYYIVLASYLAFWSAFYFYGGKLIEKYFQEGTIVPYIIMILIWLVCVSLAYKFAAKDNNA